MFFLPFLSIAVLNRFDLICSVSIRKPLLQKCITFAPSEQASVPYLQQPSISRNLATVQISGKVWKLFARFILFRLHRLIAIVSWFILRKHY